MAPSTHLALINFFIGDIQGGLGPFLGAWLAEAAEWSPRRVGLVTTLVGIGALALSGPLGALVDRVHRPRLLIILACTAILAGTLLLLPARAFLAVFSGQFLAAAGGTLLLPAVTALTLGMIGKDAFPRQQGRNQAFNHAGILVAAAAIGSGTPLFGPAIAFWVLGAMALGAIVATVATPARAWSMRRAVGWQEQDNKDEREEKAPQRSSLGAVFGNPRLVALAVALALFQLGNGGMLTLLAQKLVTLGLDATSWTARYVMVAQLVMIPVALWAGTLADRRGRRLLLVAACLALPLRAALSAFLDDPVWLVGAEVLDGIASGLVGVAVPIVVADLTWGSGRTQTAFGSLNAVQGVGGALSAGFGGAVQGWFGWQGAFLALGAAGLAALAVVFWINATAEDHPQAERMSTVVLRARKRARMTRERSAALRRKASDRYRNQRSPDRFTR